MTSARVRLVSGRLVDLLDLRADDIDFESGAIALSRLARYNGHTRADVHPYSVAEHSVHVSKHCAPQDALWGLLHDFPESLIGDCVGPLKNLPFMDGYRHIERYIMGRVCEAAGLPQVCPKSVDEADFRLLRTEMRDLTAYEVEQDHPEMQSFARAQIAAIQKDAIPELDLRNPWSAPVAAERFLLRFHELRR